MAKESKSQKIRALLAEGMLPKDIAKKLRISPNYVHTVKWHWQNKKDGKKTAAPPPATPAQVAQEATFFPISEYVKMENRLVDLIDARVRVLLQKVLS